MEQKLNELPIKHKLNIFYELSDNQKYNFCNQKRASHFFNNLNNFMNWLYETHETSFKNIMEENWNYKNLKSGQQKLEFKNKYLAVRVFKNGNCELYFNKSILNDLNLIKNNLDNGGSILDSKNIILFEQITKDFGLKKCKPFELGNGGKVFKFIVRKQEAKMLASSKKIYVTCAGYKFKSGYESGSFHRLFDDLRKCLMNTSKENDTVERVSYIPEESSIKISEIGRYVDLKNLLENEYKCKLKIEPNGINGQVTVKNKNYSLSIDKTLQIFADGFEQSIDVSNRKSKEIFGYLKVVFASCQLLLEDCSKETKRIVQKYHKDEFSEQDATVIPINDSHEFESQDTISIIHSDEEGTYLQGDTKPVKDHLKRFGFSWSWETRFWYVRGSRNRRFCDESRKRCDNLSSILTEQGYQVERHYPNAVSTLVN